MGGRSNKWIYSIRCNQRPQILQPRYGTNELKSRWYNGTVLEDAGRITVMSTMQGATTIPTGNGMIEWREEKIRQGLKCDGKTSKKNIDGGIDIIKRFPQKKAFSCTFLTLAKFCNTVFVGFFQLWIQKIWKCFEDWCAIQGVEKINFPQHFPQSMLQKWRAKDLRKSSKNSSSFSCSSVIVSFLFR